MTSSLCMVTNAGFYDFVKGISTRRWKGYISQLSAHYKNVEYGINMINKKEIVLSEDEEKGI